MSTKFSIYCVKAGYKLKISVISTSLSPITILKVYNTEDIFIPPVIREMMG